VVLRGLNPVGTLLPKVSWGFMAESHLLAMENSPGALITQARWRNKAPTPFARVRK
jgi:hypothetical protein